MPWPPATGGPPRPPAARHRRHHRRVAAVARLGRRLRPLAPAHLRDAGPQHGAGARGDGRPSPSPSAWTADPMVPPAPGAAGRRPRCASRPSRSLHHEGSPGAQAVAEHFGLQGRVRVEEVLIRQGETWRPRACCSTRRRPPSGPYRASQGAAQLFEATVRLPTGIALRPALLPWALGTAAALMGAAGAASAVSKLWKLRLDVAGPRRDRRRQAQAARAGPDRSLAGGLAEPTRG